MAKRLNGVDDETMQRLSTPYKESDQVNKEGIDASNAYFAVKNWQGSGKAQAALDKWKNTGPFSYDPDSDSLYQTAKANAIANGKVAMQDTIGQASALTGGYGNSYATTAGSQAYQNYLKSLDDDLATYYQLALDQYQQGKDDLLTEYSIENERDNTDYSRLYNMYNMAQDRYNTDRSFDYGKWSDAYQQATNLASMQNSDYWTQTNFDEGKRQFDANLAENQRQFNANLAENQRQYNTNRADSLMAGAAAAEKDRRLSSADYYDKVVTSFLQKQKNAKESGSLEEFEKINKETLQELWMLRENGAISKEDYEAALLYFDMDWLRDNYSNKNDKPEFQTDWAKTKKNQIQKQFSDYVNRPENYSGPLANAKSAEKFRKFYN